VRTLSSKQRRARRTAIELALAGVILSTRLERKWSQAKLAERAGVSYQRFTRLETAVAPLGFGELERLAEAFGMRGSDLLRLAEERLAGALRRVS
jgi:transcriptional regulator with XRE-family HTH domain